MCLTLLRTVETDSTNSDLRKRAEEDRGGKNIFLRTDYQRTGRGRGSHSWYSSPGENLLFSWLTYPAFLSASRQFLLSKVVCIAMIRLLEDELGDICLKWPNDLLAGGKKIGGILIESTLTGDRICYAICGIGLNINEKSFPEFEYPATSLFLQTGKLFDIDNLYEKAATLLLKELSELETGNIDRLDSLYLSKLYRLNMPTRFTTNNGYLEGTIRGVDQYGQLLVENNRGGQEVFAFGDIHLPRVP